jgi:hypothetical protein
MSIARPASAVFLAPARDWCVVSLASGFCLWFAESGSWRDSGFGPFASAAAAVDWVASL